MQELNLESIDKSLTRSRLRKFEKKADDELFVRDTCGEIYGRVNATGDREDFIEGCASTIEYLF